MKKTTLLLLAMMLLGVSAGAQAAEWKIDKPHTAIKFKVKHLLTNVWGEFTEYDADLFYDSENPANSKVEVKIDASSINTGNEKRDKHLRSEDFFDAEKYPHITFKSTRFEKLGENKHKMIGDLTIKGNTREIELIVDGPSDPITFMGTTKVSASAEGTINRTNYGLTWNRTTEAGKLLVGEEVTLVIDTELDKVAAEDK